MLTEDDVSKKDAGDRFNDETGSREKRGPKAAPACQLTRLTTTQPNMNGWKELMFVDATYLGPRPNIERPGPTSCGVPDKLCNTSWIESC